MNILAIGDLYVPGHVMARALAALNPSRIDVIEWPNRNIAELHHRIRQIERLGPDAERAPEAIGKYLPGADLIVTHMCPVNSETIGAAVRLRMIGVCRSAAENVDTGAARARNIAVVSVPARNAVAVAEFAIGLMIAELRNIARAHLSLATGGWRKNYSNDWQPAQLSGKTVGLVGFGAVAQTVAARLCAFGVRLIAFDPFVSSDVFSRYGITSVDLETLLRQADIVSLHARREPGDQPLIGDCELALCKPTAYLINTARGSLIDTTALADALRANRIAGAAIDVYEQEPLDADSPLRTLDNLTLTPHLAGSTLEAFHGSAVLLVERIRAEMERA
jgi:D-3-phosphoglycerate dehydrogenase